MKLAYADPPYPGLAHLYKNHADYGGEVDHAQLVQDLTAYDGFVLHTSSPALGQVLTICAEAGLTSADYRVLAWVKQWASWKPGNRVQYAWEPVILKPARAPQQRPDKNDGQASHRDWLMEPMTMQRGLVGAKPRNVCWWLFDCMGATPDDGLHDLFPGTGAVTDSWADWRQRVLPEPLALELGQ